jgi:hypothetical protein
MEESKTSFKLEKRAKKKEHPPENLKIHFSRRELSNEPTFVRFEIPEQKVAKKPLFGRASE